MEKFIKILQKSWNLALRRPLWWCLGCLQIILFSAVVFFADIKPGGFVVFAGLLCFSAITWNIWRLIPIDGKEKLKINPVLWNGFLGVFFCFLFSFFAVQLLNFILPTAWPVKVLLQSLVLLFFLAWALAMALLPLAFLKGFNVVVDLFKRRTFIMSLCCICFMFTQAFFFTAGQTTGSVSGGDITGGLSNAAGFATIYGLGLIIMIIASATAIWLNIFFVLGFLELIKPIKSREIETSQETKADLLPAPYSRF